jgi:ATP-dependent DNA helicase RecG
VVLFRVFYHSSIVVKQSNGKAFVRRGDECHEMTPEEIRELAVDKGQVPFEEEPCTLSYPGDFDLDAVHAWAAAVRDFMKSGYNLDDEEILENRCLGRIAGGGFHPNNACALLFAKNPRILFAGCRVRFMRFEGTEEKTGAKYNASKDLWAEGTIPQTIEKAEEIVASQLRTFSPLNAAGKFELQEEYPHDAWYEAIVNACVHRSYGNGMR